MPHCISSFGHSGKIPGTMGFQRPAMKKATLHFNSKRISGRLLLGVFFLAVPRADCAAPRTWPPLAVPGLIEGLRDKDENVRRQAAYGLRYVQPIEAAQPAVPALLTAAKDRSVRVRDG